MFVSIFDGIVVVVLSFCLFVCFCFVFGLFVCFVFYFIISLVCFGVVFFLNCLVVVVLGFFLGGGCGFKNKIIVFDFVNVIKQ